MALLRIVSRRFASLSRSSTCHFVSEPLQNDRAGGGEGPRRSVVVAVVVVVFVVVAVVVVVVVVVVVDVTFVV